MFINIFLFADTMDPFVFEALSKSRGEGEEVSTLQRRWFAYYYLLFFAFCQFLSLLWPTLESYDEGISVNSLLQDTVVSALVMLPLFVLLGVWYSFSTQVLMNSLIPFPRFYFDFPWFFDSCFFVCCCLRVGFHYFF